MGSGKYWRDHRGWSFGNQPHEVVMNSEAYPALLMHVSDPKTKDQTTVHEWYTVVQVNITAKSLKTQLTEGYLECVP